MTQELLRHVAELEAEVEQLLAENFALAAHMCRTPISMANGDLGCVYALQLESEIERLRVALTEITAPVYGIELFDSDEDRCSVYLKHIERHQFIARATLKGK